MDSAPLFPDFADRLARVRERIEAACRRVGRSSDGITLVAVTKRHPVAAMEVAVAHGIVDLGENRVQEALAKRDHLPAGARLHLIGRLQTNKVNKAVGAFASIMSVDREELLERLDRRAVQLGVAQPVWVQVNATGEAQKGGCDPARLPVLVEAVRAARGLELVGLMAMGRAGADPAELHATFARVRRWAEDASPAGDAPLALSVGMSGDYEIAVEEGATHLRLGTALFGPRPVVGPA